MQPGDHVTFVRDPLFYGVMRIGVKTADGRFVCEPAHPSVPAHGRRPEIFFESEIAAFTDPIVDLDAERARLEELDTQKAQDADADARRADEKGKGSE